MIMSVGLKTAVVILNWNGKSLFPRFMPSVIEYSFVDGVSIYVADNGSTDGSVDFLQQNFPQVNIVRLDENHGFPKGYNLALEQIEADIFVLLNSDVEVTGGWLEQGLRRFAEDPQLGALQPKILSYLNRNLFEYAGAAGGFIDRWGYPFCRGRVLSEIEEDKNQYDTEVSLMWASGACMFVRAELYKKQGGLDEDFFAHMEEIDFCWRIKNQGWNVGFEPSSVVYHLGGATLSYEDPKKIFLNFRNNLWLLMKNLPKGRLSGTLIIRFFLDYAAALRFLLMGQFSSLEAVAKAHWQFWRFFRKFMQKRKSLLPLAVKNKHPEIYQGMLVSDFYLKGKKKFSNMDFSSPNS
ncbi:MAG: glycosyltransferase family 2 protein [Prolixibacteraceae bacterium]|nr:glycosyltransferase family 2 protein [Prolixibacteraceae bacterium]